VLKYRGKKLDSPSPPPLSQTVADSFRCEIYYVYLEITIRETHEFMDELKRSRKIWM
jgi:hypothetical protein